jgi:hypothetical protein
MIAGALIVALVRRAVFVTAQVVGVRAAWLAAGDSCMVAGAVLLAVYRWASGWLGAVEQTALVRAPV